MSSPVVDEVLFSYLVVASHAISLVLIRVDDGVQRPVYYVSKSLNEAEVRYLPLEKGDIGCGACHEETPPLLSSAYCGRPNSTSPQVSAQERRLYREGSKMGYDSRGF